MVSHSFAPIRGRIDRFSFDSPALENRLGDPTEREVLVVITPQADAALSRGERLPVVIYLAPFTGSGPQRAGWKAFSETLPQRIERLTNSGELGDCIFVLPDTFTSLGGNQFVDSKVMGSWATWLANDLREQIETRYSTNGKWGLVGKSSGGYGALVLPMLQAEKWAAAACHSGDCGFELMFKPTFPEALTAIQPHGDIDGFLAKIKSSSGLSSSQFHCLMTVAMAATYDAIEPAENNSLGIRLPVDTYTSEIEAQAWQNWLEWDPLCMIENPEKAANWQNTKLFIDVGSSDQYHIQYGLRRLHLALEEKEIEHVWQEFDGTHSGIDHRLDISLPWLVKQLK